MPLLFSINRYGRDYFAEVDNESEFFIGRRVPYEDYIGLYNIFGGSKLAKVLYSAADFRNQIGFWADFIEPTSYCEGRNFLTLNTYDRARFTFGFGQFAAHVPGGDFVLYFRQLLALDNAGDYFPHLEIRDGHVHAIETNGASTPLETEASVERLLAYLNPSLDEVEDKEVIAAAKLIHWTVNDPRARQAQIDQMLAVFAKYMRWAEKRVSMHGRSAEQCCVIADVLHHGRGGKSTWVSIDAALKSSAPLTQLLEIGAPGHVERRRTLKKAIQANPALAEKRWNTATHDFE